jgi:putative DNA primase/helicase
MNSYHISDSLHIPEFMKQADRWLVWRLEQHGADTKKVPYQPAYPRVRASVNDSASWGTFDEAYGAVEQDASLSGVGFVLGDGWCGFDHDDASTSEEWAPFLDAVSSYAEVSQSQRGFHILFRGTLPGPSIRTHKMELYDRDRFFVVTGRHIVGTPEDVQSLTPTQVAALYRSVDDQRVTAEARRKHPALDRILTSSDVSPYPSASEQDLAIARSLSTVTRDAEQIARLMRALPTARGKYAQDDYLARTIDKVLSSTSTPPDTLLRRSDDDLLGTTTVHAAPLSGQDEEALIEKRIVQLRIDHEAKKRFRALTSGTQPRTSSPVGLDELLATADEPAQWIVDGLLQDGDVAFLWGTAKAGKSIIACDLALAVATGTSWAGRTCRSGKVLYLPYEAPGSLRPRMAGALAQRGVHSGAVTIDASAPFLGHEDDIERYANAIRPLDYSLVIVDTMTMAAGGLAIDDGSKADAAIAMRALRTLCPPNGAVLVIHHCGVDRSRLRGATSMLAAVDAEFKVEDGLLTTGAMRHADSGAFKMAYTINATSSPQRLWIEWDTATDNDADEALALKADQFLRANADATVRELREHLRVSSERATKMLKRWKSQSEAPVSLFH